MSDVTSMPDTSNGSGVDIMPDESMVSVVHKSSALTFCSQARSHDRLLSWPPSCAQLTVQAKRQEGKHTKVCMLFYPLHASCISDGGGTHDKCLA